MEQSSPWRVRLTLLALVAFALVVAGIAVLSFQKVSAPVPGAGETPGYDPGTTSQVEESSEQEQMTEVLEESAELPTADETAEEEAPDTQ